MRSHRLAATAVLTCSALALTGCSLLGGSDEPERDEDGEIVEQGDADAFAIRVGDCLETLDWSAEGFNTVPVIPCAEAHESEVYAATDLPDGDYPGDAAVAEAADEFCYAQFQGFVGMAWEDSVLEFGYLSPSQESWERGNDREVLCLIMDPTGLVSGSLAGAAR